MPVLRIIGEGREVPVSNRAGTLEGRTSVNRSPCPYCGSGEEIRRTSDTGRTQAWACDACDTTWAISVVNPESRAAAQLVDLQAATREIQRMRSTLRQVVMLADDAPTISDALLRARLLALAGNAR